MAKWYEIELPEDVTLGDLADMRRVRISGGKAYVAAWRLVYLVV